ncbi:MAG: hemolysin family protein [Planctomycetaceae bacterium]|nr:hemolysin family protein [Planctomycetaceae bacterium]
MIYLALIGLALICFASTSVVSFREFSRHQLEEICENWKKESRLRRILRSYERMAVAAESCRVIAAVVTCVCGFFVLLPLPEVESPLGYLLEFGGFVLVGTFAMMLVAVWVPSAVAQLWATPIVFYTFPLWEFLAALLYPFQLVHQFFELFFQRLAGYQPGTSDEEQFEEEIRTIVTEGHREGLLEEDAREMIESVIGMGDINVSEIMTPRTDTVFISAELSWDEMLAQIITIPHSRIPVYKENRDDVIGILFVKDLIPELAKAPERRAPWLSFLRMPHFVPETKPVDKLLQEFRNSTHLPLHGTAMNSPRHIHIAIVLDEYGGVSGLVTLEDILEEIVGEIVDESDPISEGEEIRQIEPEVYEVLGKVHLDELNDRLGMGLPDEEDFDTIGGYMFSTLGHVPEVNESLVFEKDNKRFKLIVLEASKRRVERIRIESGERGEGGEEK